MDIQNIDLSTVYTRTDGSFVVNRGLYHVPNEGEYAELWKSINEYIKYHPEVSQEEPLRTLTDVEILEIEVRSNMAYLSSTDWYCTRYIDNGVAIPDDVKLKRQKARADINILRERIAKLS